MGNIGRVPRQRCATPSGIKIPLELLILTPELEGARNSVEQAFGSRLFDGTRRHRDLQLWLGDRLMAFRMYRWILLWHPLATSPLTLAPLAHRELCPVHKLSYQSFKPPVTMFSSDTRNIWGLHTDDIVARIRFSETRGDTDHPNAEILHGFAVRIGTRTQCHSFDMHEYMTWTLACLTP